MKKYHQGFIPLLPIILIGLSTLGVGTVATAQIALPGNPLYSIKTTTEKLRLAIAITKEAKAKTHLSIAREKTEELRRINVNAPEEIRAGIEVQFVEHQSKAEEISRLTDEALREDIFKRLQANVDRNIEALSKNRTSSSSVSTQVATSSTSVSTKITTSSPPVSTQIATSSATSSISSPKTDKILPPTNKDQEKSSSTQNQNSVTEIKGSEIKGSSTPLKTNKQTE